MKYQVKPLMKPGGKIAHVVEPVGHAYHIAECKYHFNAIMIRDVLNARERHHEDSKSTKAWDWIRVEDRLPDGDIEVMVWTGEYFLLASLDADDWTTDFGTPLDKAPTHWCDPVPPINQEPSAKPPEYTI